MLEVNSFLFLLWTPAYMAGPRLRSGRFREGSLGSKIAQNGRFWPFLVEILGQNLAQNFRYRLERARSRRVLDCLGNLGFKRSPNFADFGPFWAKIGLGCSFWASDEAKKRGAFGPILGPKAPNEKTFWEFGFAKFGSKWEILGQFWPKISGTASSGIARGGFGEVWEIWAQNGPKFHQKGPKKGLFRQVRGFRILVSSKFEKWEIFKNSWVNTQEFSKISLGPTGNGLEKIDDFLKAVASRT